MSVTLIALYRRPEGGDEALATLLQRYEAEHAPLIRLVPGLRAFEVHRITKALGESDLALVALMRFDDQAALDAALSSTEMREAGRNLREIAPGLATLVIAEGSPSLGGLGGGAGSAASGTGVSSSGTVGEAGIDIP
jgi:uncharacterized protein (TIGR02118 family)